MTVLVSSHLLSEIDQMADHVGIIREGELVFQDTLETLHTGTAATTWPCAPGTTRGALKLLHQSRVPCAQEEDYILLPRLDDPDAAKLIRYLIGHGRWTCSGWRSGRRVWRTSSWNSPAERRRAS